MSGDLPPILNYADPDTGRLVIIAKFREEVSARMAASKLESEGIEAVITAPVRSAGARRSATLSVLAEDCKAAIASLENTPARTYLVRPENA
jgi:hypothetical protein